MAKNRIKACWLLLLVLLLAATMVLSVGVAQARYNNTATAVAMVQSPNAGTASNCLVTAKDAPRTVLLGELPLAETTTVPFWLKAFGSDVTAKLNWGIAEPEFLPYLDISVFAGYEEIEANTEIQLLEDSNLDLLLCVAPTELARTTPHGAMKIKVYVTWGEEMWGTFLVTLPEVMIDEPPVETSPEPAPEPTVEPTEEPTVEPTEEPTEEPTVEPTEEPTEEPTTEPSTEPTEEPTVEPTTEPTTDPGEDVGEEQEQKVTQIKTLPSFHPAEQLPVMITVTEEITSVSLGVESVYGERAYFEALPDYTMLSLDGGVNYYMLYGGYTPVFALQNVTAIPVLLDFRYAQLDESESLTLAMQTFTGNHLRDSYTATTVPSAKQTDLPVLLPQVQPEAEDPVATVAEENQTSQSLLGPILTFDNKLEFTFPVEWEEATLEYSVEYLTMTEEQTLEYIPVTLSEEELFAEYVRDEEVHSLAIRMGQRFSAPGTYRLNMTWRYEEVCFADRQITFFVNYSAQDESAQSGQEVPNDD